MIDETEPKNRGTAATITLAAGDAMRRAVPLVIAGRYTDQGLLGEGGMGEVRRVWDKHLERSVAMKLIHAGRLGRADARRRFLAEARLTAGLQHPGIVAVHELGVLDDGRAWFTMQEIRGRTLASLLSEERGPFRRLVEVLARVCAIVGYAHERGILHRDLKPDNIMVGAFGEVHVVDWGIASAISVRPIVQVVGTPAYLSPEQARGGVLGPPTDVYALGMILRELLTGLLPVEGSVTQLLQRIALGPPPPLTGLAADRAELGALAERAMAANPADRFENALQLGQAIEAWLDGTRQLERARGLVADGIGVLPTMLALRQEAEALRSRAEALLAVVPAWAPDTEKAPAWELEDQAASLERDLASQEAAYVQRLQAALMLSPDLLEAHDLLADHHRAQAERAEARADREGAALHTLLVHNHARSTRHQGWLTNRGEVSLSTEPANARMALHALVPQDRRLVPRFSGFLATPLKRHALRAGSYILRLSAPGRAEVRYPLLVERGGHALSVPPDAEVPLPIPMPLADEVASDEALVPAGWFLAGGDPGATDGLPRRRLWVDTFIMHRHPVTAGAYATFLNDLIDQGEEEAALRHAPQDRAGPRMLVRGGSGYAPQEAEPDWPVAMVSWHGALAYAQWLAARTGRPWRLPHDLEWEKAARGVDGRVWPWGDHAEPTWARVTGCAAEAPSACVIGRYAIDTSVYGVADLVGNVRDWCNNPYRRLAPTDGSRVDPTEVETDDAGDLRMIRGGHWGAALTQCRPAGRYAAHPEARFLPVGFRLVRSWP